MNSRLVPVLILLLGVPSNGQDTSEAECYAKARCLGTHFTAEFTGDQPMCCDSGVSQTYTQVGVEGCTDCAAIIPTFSFINLPYSGLESEEFVTLTLGLVSGNLFNDLVIRFMTEDVTDGASALGDYLPVDELLTFSESITTIEVNVTLINDDIFEGDEIFRGRLSILNTETNAAVITSLADVIILDEDTAAEVTEEVTTNINTEINGNTESDNGNTESDNGNTESANGNTESANGNTESANGNTESANGNTESANENTESVNGNSENEGALICQAGCIAGVVVAFAVLVGVAIAVGVAITVYSIKR